MFYEDYNENPLIDWETEHDHRITWQCPQCDYSYESARYVNEAMACPTCGCRTEQAGESYKP